MKENNRPDIAAAKFIERLYLLEELSFREIQEIIYNFSKDILLNCDSFRKSHCSEETLERAKYYSEQINQFLLGNIDAQALRKSRINAIEFYNKITNQPDRNILEFISKGLFDEEISMFHDYGADMHFSMLLFTLLKTEEPMLCQQFVDYLSRSKIMQTHKSPDNKESS
ncbi:hypothetical protein [Paracidovorax cattleyae]|uniref:hypothetical protein n=1 Tax=Paracidovorax cattleyae TaxID=80868 RepID=UPI0018AFF6C9|nr:hypothetical protein [Paracidovorax cattleyae]MBF9263996.1 hypothetical protein [Paracidovorax cattleyae]